MLLVVCRVLFGVAVRSALPVVRCVVVTCILLVSFVCFVCSVLIVMCCVRVKCYRLLFVVYCFFCLCVGCCSLLVGCWLFVLRCWLLAVCCKLSWWCCCRVLHFAVCLISVVWCVVCCVLCIVRSVSFCCLFRAAQCSLCDPPWVLLVAGCRLLLDGCKPFVVHCLVLVCVVCWFGGVRAVCCLNCDVC